MTGNGSLDTGEQVLKNRLESAGYTVTVRDDGAGDVDQDTFELIVLARRAAGNQLKAKYSEATGGVILLDPEVWDDHHLSSTTDYATNQRRAAKVVADHPVVDGLGSLGTDVSFSTSNTSLGWVDAIASSGTPIATLPDSPAVTLAAFEAGSLNRTGTAIAGRRSLVGIHTDAFPSLTPSGVTLLDQIIEWTGRSPVPASPVGLVVASALTDRVMLDWEDQPDATSFDVSVKGQTVNVGDSQLTITGLTPSTSYSVSVVAVNEWGRSDPSTAQAKTADRLAPPVNVAVVAQTETSIEISWDHADNDSHRDSYNLWLDHSYVGWVQPGVDTYRYTGLSAGTTYTLNVLATSDNPALWSTTENRYSQPASAQIEATTNPAAVTPPVIESIKFADGSTVAVTFNHAGSGSFDYSITWADADPGTSDVRSTVTSTSGHRTVTLVDAANILSESTGTVTATACLSGTTVCASSSHGGVYYARPWGLRVDGAVTSSAVPIKFGYTQMTDPATFEFRTRVVGGQWQAAGTVALTKDSDNRYRYTLDGLSGGTAYEITVAAILDQSDPRVGSNPDDATLTATTTGGVGTSPSCQNTSERYCVEWPNGFVDTEAAGGPAAFPVNGINLRDAVTDNWHYNVNKLAGDGAPAFNTLRIALNWQRFQPEAGSLDDPTNLPQAWSRLDQLIQAAAVNGFKVILDPIHVRKQSDDKYGELPGSMWNLTGWAWNDYYDQQSDPDLPPTGQGSQYYDIAHDRDEWNHHVDDILDGYALPYLQTVVARYGSNENVIAIDLVNEPRNYPFGANAQDENQELIEMQLGWVDSLRTIDPDTPLIVEPMAGNIDPTCIDFSGLAPPTRPNLMIALHDYYHGDKEGNPVDGYKTNCDSIGERSGDYSYTPSLTRQQRQASQKAMIDSWLAETGGHGVPLFIGEYGYNKFITNMTDAITDKYQLYQSVNSAGVALPRTYWVAQYDGAKELYDDDNDVNGVDKGWIKIGNVAVGTYATGGRTR